MILLLSAVLGLAIGLLSGGSLTSMRQYPLKGLLLPIIALVLKAGAAYVLKPQQAAVLVCLLQYGLLFSFVALNIRRPLWSIFVFIGTFCNFLVILLNGGRMPVSAALIGQLPQRLEALAQNRIYAYTLLNEQTVLPFLGDVIRIGPAGTPFGFASAGDFVLCVGVLILCIQLVHASPKNHPTASGQNENED